LKTDVTAYYISVTNNFSPFTIKLYIRPVKHFY